MDLEFNENILEDDEKAALFSQTLFSDIATILMAFFVIVCSLLLHKIQQVEQTDTTKTYAISAKEQTVERPSSHLSQEHPSNQQTNVDQQKRTESKEFNFKLPEQDNVSVQKINHGYKVTIGNPLLFDSGQADLKSKGKQVLKQLAEIAQEENFMLRIEGHTDNLDIDSEQFSSNWELSSMRAITVLKHILEETTIKPQNIEAVAKGEYSPIASNDTAQGRAQNRRVEINLLNNMI